MLNHYPHNDKIKQAIKDCADFVVKDGLNYLIPTWKEFAESVDKNDGSIIYEYLNDLDTRNIIDRILPFVADEERNKIVAELEQYDKNFISKTFATKECLWGQENEIKNGYTRQKNFYYYRAPQYLIDAENGIEKIVSEDL
jgi:hypothetical protein